MSKKLSLWTLVDGIKALRRQNAFAISSFPVRPCLCLLWKYIHREGNGERTDSKQNIHFGSGLGKALASPHDKEEEGGKGGDDKQMSLSPRQFLVVLYTTHGTVGQQEELYCRIECFGHPFHYGLFCNVHGSGAHSWPTQRRVQMRRVLGSGVRVIAGCWTKGVWIQKGCSIVRSPSAGGIFRVSCLEASDKTDGKTGTKTVISCMLGIIAMRNRALICIHSMNSARYKKTRGNWAKTLREERKQRNFLERLQLFVVQSSLLVFSGKLLWRIEGTSVAVLKEKAALFRRKHFWGGWGAKIWHIGNDCRRGGAKKQKRNRFLFTFAPRRRGNNKVVFEWVLCVRWRWGGIAFGTIWRRQQLKNIQCGRKKKRGKNLLFVSENSCAQPRRTTRCSYLLFARANFSKRLGIDTFLAKMKKHRHKILKMTWFV